MQNWQFIAIVMIFYAYYNQGENINFELDDIQHTKFNNFYNICIIDDYAFRMKTITNIISTTIVSYLILVTLDYLGGNLSDYKIINIFYDTIKNVLILTFCWFMMQFVFYNMKLSFIKYNDKFILISKIHNIDCFKFASKYI